MSSQADSEASVPEHAQIIDLYLTTCLPLVREKFSDPSVKAGVQVFILGMVDMLRGVEELNWGQFVGAYGAILRSNDLVPSCGAEAFVQRVGSIAASTPNIEKLMRQGAQSIQMYVAKRDADAPTDLGKL
ncbi:hypothetical protein [Rhodanobacter thiooxydans]|uniref:hypothetical protein n=1 Tax=Rhodanobacter thiooxydans TaxID=416169 RepID=UPI00128FED3E|nr:hypothetical protein [Rhodanobacter thiooxydans]